MPIIVVTALDGREDRIRAIQLGANDFISKPVDRTELGVRIAAQMRILEARDALRDSERQHRSITECANVGIFTITLEGTFIQANQTAARMAGYETIEEFMSISAEDLYVHAKDRECLVKDLLAKGSVRDREILGRKKDGRLRWLTLNAALQKDHRGNPVAIIGIAEDVTERKKAEEARLETERRYRNLVENSPDGVAITLGGRFVFCNNALTRILGAAGPDYLTGKPVVKFIHPEFHEVVSERIRPVVEGESAPLLEQKYLRVDGETVDVEVANSGITYNGESARRQIIVRDITQRKRVEEALRASQERYRALMETSPAVIWTMDLDLKYTYLSPAITKALGYTVDEMMSMDLLQCLTPCSREKAIRAFKEELALEASSQRDTRASRTVEIERYHKDGTTRWAEITMSFLRDDTGHPSGIIGISHDTTERRKAEKERIESEEKYP